MKSTQRFRPGMNASSHRPRSPIVPQPRRSTLVDSMNTRPAPPPAPPLIDWEKIQIKTTDLGNSTYMLEGQGGNITVAVGSDGITMVDSQFAPLSDKIKAAIKAISPLPVKYLINTHFHGDHTGGK